MKKQEEKQLLVFGHGLTMICLLLAWRQYAKHGWTIWVEGSIIVAALVLALVLFNKSWLKILFNIWMKVAGVVGVIMTSLILTLFFFGVITPFGFVLRLLGKDFLKLQFRDQRDSYWVNREEKKEDYTKQF